MPQDNISKQLIINQLTKEQYNELANNSQLSSSELYVITDDNHYTEQEIVTLLATKQDLLTAGENIVIDSNNVINLDLTNVYLKEELDEILSNKADLLSTGYSLEYSDNILTLRNINGTILSYVTIKSILQTDDISVNYNKDGNLQSIGEITKNNTPKFTWIGTEEEYQQDLENGIIDEHTECLILDSEAESVTPIVEFKAPTKLSELANDMDFTTNAVVQEIKTELQQQIDEPFDESNLVHKTGTETIEGFKSFTEGITIKNGSTKGRISHKNSTSETPTMSDGYIEFGENTLIYGKESPEGLLYHTENDIFHSGNLVAGENITIIKNGNVYTINGQAGGGTGGGEATGGTTVYVDNETIIKNEEEVITAVGIKTQNGTIVYDWIGTLEEYNTALENGIIQPNWICWITDDDNTNNNNTTTNKQTYGSDIALLDIIITNQALEGVDKIGKELQGSLILKSEYPDAYKKLINNKGKLGSKKVTETVSDVEITYTQCSNGWKIMDISDKDMYDQLFETTGTANFFVLDELNQSFYLPKTNNILQPNANIEKLGEYNEAGLPNIEGTINSEGMQGPIVDGAFKSIEQGTNFYHQSTSATATTKMSFDASLSNPIYGNSDTVQPQSTNVFIYYKVGNTLQESATIDMEAQILNLKDKIEAGMFNMFDTKTVDHVLQGEESKGWALQGSYVYKNKSLNRYGYPTFYETCLREKELGTPTEVTLGENVVTMYIHSNGHQYFDIADLEAIESWYTTYGIAWFYGIDTENERVLLPRNKWFEQLTGNVSEVNQMVEAGLPNITGEAKAYLWRAQAASGAFGLAGSVGNPDKGTSTTNNFNSSWDFDASRSNPIYGNSDTVQPPASKKLLYICVGTTQSVEGLVNVTELTTSENDTIPLLYSTYQTTKLSSAGWLRADNKPQYGTLYVSVYDYLESLLDNNTDSIPVIEVNDMVEGEDYTKHFKIDLTNQTFTLPIRTNERILVAKKEATDEDKTWYNLYSDGWCEQGGHVPELYDDGIVFLRPYINTNYTISAIQSTSTNVVLGIGVGSISPKTDRFYFTTLQTQRPAYWSTSGYTQIPTLEEYTEPLYLYFKVGNAVQHLEVIDMLHQADLNTPFFLGMSKYFENTPNNLSWLKSEGQWNSKEVYVSYYQWLEGKYNNGDEDVKLHTEEYTDYDYVLNQEEGTFRLPLLNGEENLIGDKWIDLPLSVENIEINIPANGWLFAHGTPNDVTSYHAIGWEVLQSGTRKYLNVTGFTSIIGNNNLSNTRDLIAFCPIQRNNAVRWSPVRMETIWVHRFIYAKGNGSLYYYVGETVQNANLINAGRIEETLAYKVDINSSWGFPSNKYIDLTLGASGTTYTAPANGWFLFNAFSVNANRSHLSVENTKTGIGMVGTVYTSNAGNRVFVPVKKGDVIGLYYSNTSSGSGKFIYAEGEV